MRGFEWRTVLAATIAACGVFVAAGAQAHDDDDWRWRHRHHGRWHHEVERQVVVERQPVFVERRPVYVAPAPVMMAPMYSQPVDPSLNLNFTIPLH